MEVIRRQVSVARYPAEELHYFGWDDHIGGEDHDAASWRRYMSEAADRGALIWKVGDIVGGISHHDPRYTARTNAHKRDDFADAVIEDLVRLFTPYADHVAGLGIGNHEWQFIKHYGVNPIIHLVRALNAVRSKALEPIAYMDYCGVIWSTYRRKGTAGGYHGYQVAYHHGSGGNAPVTEGVIAAKRMVESFDGIDALVIGHVHKNWSLRNERFRVNRQGQIEARPIRLICGGSHQTSYKQPGEPGLAWSEMKGFRPSPFGGAFLKIMVRDKAIEARVEH